MSISHGLSVRPGARRCQSGVRAGVNRGCAHVSIGGVRPRRRFHPG
jgi:hypothetical protein